MSTGDQTQYIRSKMAERGSERGASFMRDGFDRWAESETPARSGQMEKIPAETQMVNYGGAMSLSRAKKLQMSIHGGAGSVNIAGIEIPIPDYISDGIKVAKEMIKVVEWVVAFLPEFEEDVRDNIIGKPADYAPQVIEDSKELLALLEGLRPWLDSIKYLLDVGKSLGGMFGSGRRGGKKLVGGDWAATFEAAKQTAETLINWYLWIKQKAATIRAVLALDSVQNAGGDQLSKVLEPIFGAIGASRYGGMSVPRKLQAMTGNDLKMLEYKTPKSAPGRSVGGRKCCCDDYSGGAVSSRPVGGRSSLTKLKSLLQPGNVPRLPSVPRMLGGRSCGGAKQYGMMEAPPMRGSVGGKKPSARGEVVKKVMREQGLSLPQASKYVKDYGLY